MNPAITINGEKIYPQTLMKFVNTPDELRKSGGYFESQIVERTSVIKETEKC